jgi:threonine dehydratase
MAGRVDEMRTVTEVALHEAQTVLTDELGITVEGAAAATWAGLFAGPRPDGPVLIVITGSNT